MLMGFNPFLKLLEQTAKAGFMPVSNINLICGRQHPHTTDKMATYRFYRISKMGQTQLDG